MKKTKKPKYKYKYEVEIIWSAEDNAYIARVPELKGCATHGETFEEAAAMVKDAIDEYLDGLRQMGKEIPVPIAEQKFSGNIPYRTDPEFHRKLALKAREKRAKSLNQFIDSLLREAV